MMASRRASEPGPDYLGCAKLLIDGRWLDGTSGSRSTVLNPATGEPVSHYTIALDDDVASAALAAERAQSQLARLGALGRSRLLRAAADALRRNSVAFASTLTLEQGKPLRESRLEVESTAELLEWFAEEARRTYGRVIPARSPSVRQVVTREPVGPVAAFAPWNFPLSQLARKVGPALAAGCPIVLKPAEQTPATAVAFARALIESGLPDGALNLLFGDPERISRGLIEHPAIRKISFTGSVPVGRALAARAGAAMKRATMELGGHAPAIVTARADVERAALELARAKFRNAGQVCVAPTRFLVEAPIYGRFLDRFVEAAESLRVGDGMDERTDMGPLGHARRVESVEALVRDAVDHGGRVATGGRRLGERGCFYAPTVIDGAHEAMRGMNEEPFGPIALLSRVRSLDEALLEANRLPYGLAAYAYCGGEEAERIARNVQCGMVSVNHVGLGLPETPFGGIRDSGYGSEGGTEALDAYVVPRLATFAEREANA